jgi:hypothetical protein
VGGAGSTAGLQDPDKMKARLEKFGASAMNDEQRKKVGERVSGFVGRAGAGSGGAGGVGGGGWRLEHMPASTLHVRGVAQPGTEGL